MRLASSVASRALATELPAVRAIELTLFATPVFSLLTSATRSAGIAAYARLVKADATIDPTMTCHEASCATARDPKPITPRT
ncbi:hypothetical protein GS504_00340, partial [Rhodococcus hoagii]|nr:hypothetical protein [Prescottella equi]